ncbi:hypothetical protein [Anaerosporobacter sp.]
MITQVDMLTLIPRTNEVSNVKQVEMQRPMQEQAQMNSTFQQQIKHEQRKTVESQKGENKEFRYDAKEKGNEQTYGDTNKKGKKKKEEIPVNTHPTNGGSFDIKI